MKNKKALAATLTVATLMSIAPSASAAPFFGSTGFDFGNLFNPHSFSLQFGKPAFNEVSATHYTPNAVTPHDPGSEQWRQERIDYTFRKLNELRRSLGLHELKLSPALMESADLWSRHMAATRNFNHSRTGVNENIALSPYVNKVDGAFNQWLNSPGHYENMILPDVHYVGLGFAYDSREGRQYSTMQLL